MNQLPKWYFPVTIAALLWNLMGCGAFMSDVLLTAEDVAKMSADQQAIYASRPTWAVAATGVAVWGGALGSLGLILRRRWALPLLSASLIGLVVQDVAMFVLSDVLQGVWLGRTGIAGPRAGDRGRPAVVRARGQCEGLAALGKLCPGPQVSRCGRSIRCLSPSLERQTRAP